MSQPDSNVDVNIRAQTGALGPGLAQAQSQIRGAVASMRSSFDGLAGIAGTLSGALAAIGAVFAGGAFLGDAIEHVNDLGEELGILSQKTGATTEELSRLRFVALQSDVDFETVGGSLQKLARTMDAARSGSKEAAAAFADVGVPATDAAGKLRPLTAVMLDLSDRFAAMPDGAAKTAAAMALFGRGGASMIPLLNQGREAIAALAAESDALGATMTADQRQIAAAYDDSMNRVHTAMEGVKNQIGLALMPALTKLGDAFTDAVKDSGRFAAAFDLMKGVASSLAVALLNLPGAVRMAAFALDPRNWGAGFVERYQELRAAWEKNMRLDAYEMAGTDVTQGEGPGGKSGGGSSAAAEKARRAKILESDVFRDGELAKVQIARDALAQRRALGDVSDAEALAAERALLDQEHQARVNALGREMEIERGHQEELQQLAAEGARERQRYDVAVARNAGEQAAEARRGWEAALAPIRSGIEQALSGLVTGTSTLRTALVGVFLDIEQQIARSLARTVTRWAAHELAKTGATAAGTAQRLALEAAAFAKSLALAIAHGLKHIAIEAAKAAAATYSAIAQLGLPGVIAAPLLAGAALVTVLNYGKKIASAAGGYDIPAGVNPVTQLHAQEMVLPAKYADVIRGMADGGGTSGGAPVHLHLKANDSRDARRFLLDNHEALAEAVTKAVRAGLLTGGER